MMKGYKALFERICKRLEYEVIIFGDISSFSKCSKIKFCGNFCQFFQNNSLSLSKTNLCPFKLNDVGSAKVKSETLENMQ